MSHVQTSDTNSVAGKLLADFHEYRKLAIARKAFLGDVHRVIGTALAMIRDDKLQDACSMLNELQRDIDGSLRD